MNIYTRIFKYPLTDMILKSNFSGDVMPSIREKFKFLEDGVDFPFYNDIPKLSTAEWLLLLVPVIIILILLSVPSFNSDYLPYIFGIVTLIPALYVCKGNYGLLFKKPKARDFITIILCLVGYYVYSFGMAILLSYILGYPVSADAVVGKFNNPSVFLVAGMIMQLIGEELFKIFMLLIGMYVIYKITKNRGLAIGLALIISMSIFGVAHSRAYNGKILQVLLIQGFGAFFNLYAYMKTKNVIVSYIVHIFIDFIPFTLVIIHNMG